MTAEADTLQGVESAMIEDFGTYIGQAMGWPPMAGRAAGVLMLSESPLTLKELQTALGASMGSVSETTRLLITSGTVQRFKAHGTRHFVYQWRDDAWIGCLQHQLGTTVRLLDLAKINQQRAVGLGAKQRERIRDMSEFYTFMVDRFEQLAGDYATQRAVPAPREAKSPSS